MALPNGSKIRLMCSLTSTSSVRTLRRAQCGRQRAMSAAFTAEALEASVRTLRRAQCGRQRAMSAAFNLNYLGAQQLVEILKTLFPLVTS